MRLLLHACCAPCSTYSVQELSKEHEVTLLWYNPNIHPYKEYGRRKDSFLKYVDMSDLRSIVVDDYSLETFLQGALNSQNRCEFCYELRLQKTAEIAAEKDFDAFTTTLTISPYQNHRSITEIGDKVGAKYGMEFIYNDLREGFRKSHEMARDLELYLQGYCGCIFSEFDRYKK